MSIIIKSAIHNLNKSQHLLERIDSAVLKNNSVSPYYSCVGSHIRHVLDFYDCILEGLHDKQVDLTNRKRDLTMHENCDYAQENVSRVIARLHAIANSDLHQHITVVDDLGLGKTDIPYTLGGLLAQANSHAIHHYAIISYILDRLGIQVNDDTFGYNPTSPKEVNLN